MQHAVYENDLFFSDCPSQVKNTDLKRGSITHRPSLILLRQPRRYHLMVLELMEGGCLQNYLRTLAFKYNERVIRSARWWR